MERELVRAVERDGEMQGGREVERGVEGVWEAGG